MATLVNGLKYQEALRAAGVPQEQATKMAEALNDAISTDSLATRADLQAGLAEAKVSIIMWMIGIQFAFAALIIAVLKFGH